MKKSDILETFESRYDFEFDDFQRRAILEIQKGNSVIVSAPTGAGKTLIAEFAIYRALLKDEHIAYTTPLKALSNQKYADFCRQFTESKVGILTGDVKINPDAPLVVMTTEILRNMIYERNIKDISYIVLDECHYMGNEDRGTVWEEIIINCPFNVQIIGLSATVSNIEEIADWIGMVHNPITPIIQRQRPVPLEFLICNSAGKIYPINKTSPGSNPKKTRKVSFKKFDINSLVMELNARRLLPAIYFIFSRAGCERALSDFLTEGLYLLDKNDRKELERSIEEISKDYAGITFTSEINQMIYDGLRHGVSVHHAGILPIIKRLTEILFEKGLVRVVFATETMSLGIHMPAKTVVINTMTKRTERGFRELSHNELIQMAGRAGRRGIDPEGKCIIVVHDKESLQDANALIRKAPEAIESQFRLGYSSVALLKKQYSDSGLIRKNIESNFGQYQNMKKIKELENEIEFLVKSYQEELQARVSCGDIENALKYLEERQKRRGIIPLTDFQCHICRSKNKCEKIIKRLRRIKNNLDNKKYILENFKNAYWDRYTRVINILEEFGYISQDMLTIKGEFIAGLRHENELLVGEIIFRGILDRLSSPEISALLSCILEESRGVEKHMPRRFLKSKPVLFKKIKAIERITEEIKNTQKSHAVFIPVAVNKVFVMAVYRWASGESDWEGITKDSFGGHEGDLIRAIRRLIDLERQLLDSEEISPDLHSRLRLSLKNLDRDIVFESALI